MKKKNREVSVFSVSALDLFCSAMGVFMILFFINMSQSEDPQNENTPALSLHLYLETTEAPASEKNRTWDAATQHDVDMKITAAVPGESSPFIYTANKATRQSEGSPALYITDGHKGQPDIWLHPQMTPGNYLAEFSVSQRKDLIDNAQSDTDDSFTEEYVKCYIAQKSSDNSLETGYTREYTIRGYRVKLIVIKNGSVLGAWAREMSPSEFKLGASAPLVNITVTPENITITPDEGVSAVNFSQQDFLQSDRF